MEIALNESDRELESLRLQLHQANKRADNAQRERMNLCGELEMRNELFQESGTHDCQEIEELRRRCCEENDGARQAKLDEWSLQQERDLDTVSQLLTQIQDRIERILPTFPANL